MCKQQNASMEETLRAEVECLRKVLAEKDKEIQRLYELDVNNENHALLIENDRLKEYERIVTSYNMKPIDYDLSCRVVTRLLDEKKRLRQENKELKELLKECELWFTGVVGNMNDKNVGEHNRNLPIGNFEYIFKVFSQKINQVLGEE
jgi:hypothetical protein